MPLPGRTGRPTERPSPARAQIELWPAPPAEARPPESLAERLRRLGLPPVPRIATHQNRTVMVSFLPGRALRIHRGFETAPDRVLAAIVRFVTPGVRRATRLAARRELLAFPIPEAADPARSRSRRREPVCVEDAPILARLAELHRELNARYFEGRLREIRFRLSGRMRSRLGEVTLERGSGAATEIGISRRHLRRDGWTAVRATLLHEMVHQWQAESGLPVNHGREFRRKLGELG